jgi:predicted DsbA family dithiol-disulfide isomerase
LGVHLRWTAFPLHPRTPPEGRTLEELFAGRPVDVAQMKIHVRQTAQQLGLPFGERAKTYNSRLAQELGKWAEAKGQGDAFHEAVFTAYFVEGRNIYQTEILAGIAEKVGLPGQEAAEIIRTRAFKEAVDQDWQRSHAKGVTAVPTFGMNDRLLTGFQPDAALAAFVQAAAGVG